MNVYLIVSDSYKLIQTEVNKIIQSSLNVIKYDLRKDTIEDVINEANYFSLTNEKKYIVVNSHTLFKSSKKENEPEEDNGKNLSLLEKYLDSPSELSTIIFTSMEVPDKRRKLFKKIEKEYSAIIIPPLNKKDMTFKCMDLLKQNGYQTTYDVANYIVENSYCNYDIMTNELEKIYVLLPKGKILIDNLKDVISISYNDNVFSYINAIIKRDLLLADKTSKHFEVLKIDPAMVLIMLAKEFEILLMIKAGVNMKDLQNHLRKEDWQMKSYLENVQLYTISELKKIIIRLNDYDYKYKSGLLDKSVILDLLSIELCE